jgi:hypothetical protein
LTVALLFASRLGPVALLGLPPRPGPRRLPARLAAIALPRPSWPKALLTSFEQTQPRPRSARQPFSRAALLIFGMACCTLGRAHGRSLLPEAPAPEGIALLSGAQQIFGSIRDQQLYRKDQMSAGRASPLRRSLLPRQRRRGWDSRRPAPSFPLKPVQVGWWPVTATHHWRSGPRRPAKMAPSPTAANTSHRYSRSRPYPALPSGRIARRGWKCSAPLPTMAYEPSR